MPTTALVPPAAWAQAAPAAPVPQPEIDDRARWRRRRAEALHHVRGGDEMQGRVVEREGGAFAGAIEAAGHRVAAFDVGRRQRAQGARHLNRAQVCEIPCLGLGVPRGKKIRYHFCGHRLDVRARRRGKASSKLVDALTMTTTEGYLRMRTPTTVLAILLTLAAAAPRLHAQSPHVASQAALDAAIQQHLDQTGAQREAVLRVLDRDEVKAVAGRAGIDLTTAATAVASMQGEQLAAAAAQAAQVEQALAGGQSKVVISTTDDHHQPFGPHLACCRLLIDTLNS